VSEQGGSRIRGHIGLYYPYVHFRSDTWVKLSALYWGKIGRIVPRGYPVCDSDTVRTFADEFGLIENFEPVGMPQLRVRFLQLLQKHEAALVGRYNVVDGDCWEGALSRMSVPRGFDPKFAWIHVDKVDHHLADQLVRARLAIRLQARGRPEDPSWIGTHPRIASVYMTALAEEMAGAFQMHPVTDSVVDHVAVSGFTMERLAQVLLGDEEDRMGSAGRRVGEVEGMLALIAIHSVIPKDLSRVAPEAIMKIRQEYGGHYAAFRERIVSMRIELQTLATVADLQALEAHLVDIYETQLKPELDALQAGLRSLKVDTAFGVLSASVSLPEIATMAVKGAVVSSLAAGGVGAALGDPTLVLHQPALASGVAALSFLPVLRAQYKQRQELLQPSPAAYLYRLRHIHPQSLISSVSDRLRAVAH
jgi:hypothetical protein